MFMAWNRQTPWSGEGRMIKVSLWPWMKPLIYSQRENTGGDPNYVISNRQRYNKGPVAFRI
jgi:hypothetical protein